MGRGVDPDPTGRLHPAGHHLAELLGPVRRDEAELVVLGPAGMPIGVVRGPVAELLELLAMTSPFTFALADRALTWLVLDMPDNVLVVGGTV